MNDDNDFLEEEPTPRWNESMAEIMRSMGEGSEVVRSPGIPTLTSDRPTRPIRPSVMDKIEERADADQSDLGEAQSAAG